MRVGATLSSTCVVTAAHAVAAAAASADGAVGGVPSLVDMAGSWIDLTRPVSEHVNASQLDLPMIANFHGSVGSSPNGDWDISHTKGGVSSGGVRPVDMFAINSLEIPPFAGCGNSANHGTHNGCGRMLVGGKQVEVTSTRYRADEVARRGYTTNGLAVDSRLRMLFEKPGVLWRLNVTNPSDTPSTAADFEFELSAMVNELAHVAWVQPLPYDPANFSYTEFIASAGVRLRGIASMGKSELRTSARRPAVRH